MKYDLTFFPVIAPAVTSYCVAKSNDFFGNERHVVLIKFKLNKA